MIKLRVGGVPEHFNLPWHLAAENNEFKDAGIDFEWTTFKGGTGQMTKALREDEIDICVLLTEGIITDIVNGNPTKIISQYIVSPLIWGVHTSVNNPLNNYKNIFDKTFAISRFGSGSHLMPIVDAKIQQKQIKQDQFKIIKNLDEALPSLSQLETDVFYWEKFTTKPYVDNGTLKRIGEFITPWPCFVIAASNKIIEKHPQVLAQMLKIIQANCLQFMHDTNSIQLVSDRMNLKIQDVTNWFYSTEWATDSWVSNKMIQNVLFALKDSKIIQEDAKIPELIWKR